MVRRTTLIDALILLLLWLGSVALVNPVGDFPLVDDWSYGITLRHFLETGDFRTNYAAMTLITHVLWGSLFCLPGGFSFTALRFSTLVAGYAGVLGCYLIMRQLCQPRSTSIVAALLVAFNPIYFALSNTFMTEVPFTALFVFAALFFARNLKAGSDGDLILATLFAVAATLSRQFALAVPIAFAPCLLRARGIRIGSVLRAVAPMVVCLGTLFAFRQWEVVTGRLSPTFDRQSSYMFSVLGNPRILAESVYRNAFVFLLYTGLFLLPLLTIVATRTAWSRGRLLIAVAAIAAALGIIDVAQRYQFSQCAVMPVSPSILTRYGIGPIIIGRPELLDPNDLPSLPMYFWIAVTAVSILGAALFIATIAERGGRTVKTLFLGREAGDNEIAALFFSLIAFIYLTPILIAGPFDRYFVPAVPFLAAWIAAAVPHSSAELSASRKPGGLAVALLAAYALFAVCSTRDYLEWNRVRWQALHDLIDKDHVPPTEINGGFEYNGLYLYDPIYWYNSDDYAKKNPTKYWWWVDDNTFIVSIAGAPGYEVVKEYDYFRWAPPRAAKVVVLHKRPPSGA